MCLSQKFSPLVINIVMRYFCFCAVSLVLIDMFGLFLHRECGNQIRSEIQWSCSNGETHYYRRHDSRIGKHVASIPTEIVKVTGYSLLINYS